MRWKPRALAAGSLARPDWAHVYGDGDRNDLLGVPDREGRGGYSCHSKQSVSARNILKMRSDFRMSGRSRTFCGDFSP